MTGRRLGAFGPRRVGSAFGPPLVFLAGLIAFWKLALHQEWVADIILPHPEDIAVSFAELITSDFVWDDIWATFYESVAGFALGAALGIGLALGAAGILPRLPVNAETALAGGHYGRLGAGGLLNPPSRWDYLLAQVVRMGNGSHHAPFSPRSSWRAARRTTTR